MKPALELLVSRAFDGALAPEHQADLDKLGLSSATVRAALLRSVPPTMLPRLLGFDAPKVVSALLFPFRSPTGGLMDHVRVKTFPGLTDEQGHSIKYLGPRGAGPRLYFAPATHGRVVQGAEPLWLVEGVKKSLAVAQVGLPAVGFEGIEGWHQRGSRDLLFDFDAIPLTGRTVELLPDGDVQTNPDVARGAARLAEALRRRGARARLVLLPATLEELGR
jgi:hypothetical protein